MKTLIWWAPFCSGGICDRMLGIVTTYCIAKQLNRKFLIKIDNFDIPFICPINRIYDYRYNECNYVEYIDNNIEQQKFFENNKSVDEWNNVENVLMWSNQNLFYHFCKNRPEVNYKKNLLEGFSILFTEIFNLIKLDIPDTKDCIGIHIRTVDKHFKNPSSTDIQSKIEQIPYIRKVLSKCKDHIMETKDKSTIFITSDCDLAYDIAKDIFPYRNIIYNNGEIVHSGTVHDGEGLKKVFIDLLSLSRCKKVYMGWNTNFSRVSALISPSRDYYIYEFPNKNCCIKCDILDIANYFSLPLWRQ